MSYSCSSVLSLQKPWLTETELWTYVFVPICSWHPPSSLTCLITVYIYITAVSYSSALCTASGLGVFRMRKMFCVIAVQASRNSEGNQRPRSERERESKALKNIAGECFTPFSLSSLPSAVPCLLFPNSLHFCVNQASPCLAFPCIIWYLAAALYPVNSGSTPPQVYK